MYMYRIQVIMVGHVTPEAYEGGRVALVQNGDIITVDTQNRTLDLVSYTHRHTINGCTLLPNMVTTRGMQCIVGRV